MPEGPGSYDFPTSRRGDTFRARDIATITQDGNPLAVTSARLQVRAKNGGAVVLEWDTATGSATITGAGSNVVHLNAKTAAQMQYVPTGTHEYDLELVFTSDGATLTILAGNVPITADTTRTA